MRLIYKRTAFPPSGEGGNILGSSTIGSRRHRRLRSIVNLRLIVLSSLTPFFGLLLLDTHVVQAEPGKATAFELYERGDITEARMSFENDLRVALRNPNLGVQWQALMAIAWFEDELSEHRKSIEHSNLALEVAQKTKSPFMLGRSLCWLAWAYSGLGLYETAVELYKNAIEIGAPDGKIEIVHVWGLATQELGSLKIKMGEVSEGRKLIERTFTYAEEQGIDVGVAEGGAALAELAILQGRFSEAEALADQALAASKSCRCSLFNETRARVVKAKAVLERASFNPELKTGLRESLEGLLADCEKLKHVRCIAETKMLLSKLLPPEDFDTRYKLVAAAFEALANSESELRGLAEAELGRVFQESEQQGLSEFYLRNGLEVNASMLRKIDASFIRGSLSDISGLKKHTREQILQLQASVKDADSHGALPLALESRRKLIEVLVSSSILAEAFAETDAAIALAEKLLTQNPVGSAERNRFQQIRLELFEKRVALGLNLYREPMERPN